MAAQAPFEILSKWAYEELFKRYTLELPTYCSKRVTSFCTAIAEHVESVDTLVFGEMLITVATISAKCVAQMPGEAVETHPNQFVVVISPSSSGKTAAYKPFEQVRAKRFELTGIPSDASFGSDMGAVGSIAAVVQANGAPLLTADEGLDELCKFLLDKKNDRPSAGNGAQASSAAFGAARCLNMLYSGTTYTRAYKTQPDLVISDCFLSLLAAGTPVHYDRFRDLFSDRGSQDGFRTRVLPLFSKKRFQPLKNTVGDNRCPEEDNILGCGMPQLMALFQESFLLLASWFDSEACEPLAFNQAACNALDVKKREIHSRNLAEEGTTVDETFGQTWRRLTKPPKSDQDVPNERFIELTKKMAIALHLVETIFSWIDFNTLQLRPHQFVPTIGPASVRAALALVLRSRQQEMFYERMLKHCSVAVAARQRVIPEHADIVLVDTLTARFLLWPGPVVTWESAVDRYGHWFLTLSFDDCIEAVDTLTDYGQATRNESKRFATGGAKVLLDEPERTFRFYKTPPALIDPAFLTRFGIHMDDYKARFEMEFKQVRSFLFDTPPNDDGR